MWIQDVSSTHPEAPKLRKKIMIIDDEPDIVEFVDYNLKREQFETCSAADGPAAVRMARDQQPDLRGISRATATRTCRRICVA